MDTSDDAQNQHQLDHDIDQHSTNLSQNYGLTNLFEKYYLQYASYVILQRAIPHIDDGLKPVNRRILHSLNEMEDGRYNKVANVIGHCMRYHPHGDAAIGEALVNLGQKGLLIDTQGNWGHYLTGDKSAAPRYIEARLSSFSKEVVFAQHITEFVDSYDGRCKEPVTLPIRFPLLLFLGVEGIAVGLACKVFSHNFCELLQASIDIIDGKDLNNIELYPDFQGGGIADVSDYNNGIRGGKIKHRAKIDIISKSLLVITQIPHETTTHSVIESILLNQEKGRFKFKKVEDNTTSSVKIELHLKPGQDPQKVRSALYAFTKCQVSLSSNICVIKEHKPIFLSVQQLVKYNTEHTIKLNLAHLKVLKAKLEQKVFFAQLEKIFIENKLYQVLEYCDSNQMIIDQLAKKLQHYQDILTRSVGEKDILYLSEIKIRRISLYDSTKLNNTIKKYIDELSEINDHIIHIKEYSKKHFRDILQKYSSQYPRKTLLKTFKDINKSQLDINRAKVFVDQKQGFIGTEIKGDLAGEYSLLQELIVITEEGLMQVIRPALKSYIGVNILYVNEFDRNDQNTIYNIIYRIDKKSPIYAKRCTITSIVRDKAYNIIGRSLRSSANSSDNHRSDQDAAEILFLKVTKLDQDCTVKIYLKSPKNKLNSTKKTNKLSINLDFNEVMIKSRSTQGKIITRKSIAKITQQK